MARNHKVAPTSSNQVMDSSLPDRSPKDFDKATLTAIAILVSTPPEMLDPTPSRFHFSALPNRRYSKDRPTRASHLNTSHYMKRTKDGRFGGWKDFTHPCAESGHDYRFERNDNYGRCKCCGDELLV